MITAYRQLERFARHGLVHHPVRGGRDVLQLQHARAAPPCQPCRQTPARARWPWPAGCSGLSQFRHP
uniref:Uncharacterized protein n=1 Tax=Anopheles dirus TaxID=7168 RepID=A0A182NYU1_9DIPT